MHYMDINGTGKISNDFDQAEVNFYYYDGAYHMPH